MTDVFGIIHGPWLFAALIAVPLLVMVADALAERGNASDDLMDLWEALDPDDSDPYDQERE